MRRSASTAFFVVIICAAAVSQSACNKVAPAASTVAEKAEKAVREAPPDVVIPQGTQLQVRLDHGVSTDDSRTGDRFRAVLAADVVIGARTVMPQGAVVSGVVSSAAPSGRLKGRAVISLIVDRVEWNGRTYKVVTTPWTRTSGDHKKRNWAMIGGGSGVGALIGGIAGGGRGALIGAGAGAAAGTAGAAITGKQQVRVPAESLLTFRLMEPVAVEAVPVQVEREQS